MSSRRTLVWRTAPAAHGVGMALSALLLTVAGVLVLLPLLSLLFAVLR